MSTSNKAISTWAPLGVGIFRALWLAALVSNIGTWMQTVGAQWLLVHQAHASLLVSLVQTADMLPDVLLAYVGGVLADTFDRRWLLIIVQGCLALTGLALTLLTIAGQMPPALLLTFTFLLGAGSAFTVPAYQALIPDLIPRAELTSASALSSININLARAIGPAIAGVLIAQIGVWQSSPSTPLPFSSLDLYCLPGGHPQKRLQQCASGSCRRCGPGDDTCASPRSCAASCCVPHCFSCREARCGRCCPWSQLNAWGWARTAMDCYWARSESALLPGP
jgi:hypothetical protein